MSPETRVLLLLTISASALFLRSEAAGPRKLGFIVDRSLNDICKTTDHVAVCVSTIGPLLKGRKADPVAALKAGIEAAAVRFREAKQRLDTATASPRSTRTMKDCLSVCTENYDSALDSLQSSLQAIDRRDRGTLGSELSAVLTFIETCNDTFSESPGVRSPVSVTASILAKIGSNCLAIAQQIRL